jgi:hypothetical protein
MEIQVDRVGACSSQPWRGFPGPQASEAGQQPRFCPEPLGGRGENRAWESVRFRRTGLPRGDTHQRGTSAKAKDRS